jgi:hypothetical protein
MTTEEEEEEEEEEESEKNEEKKKVKRALHQHNNITTLQYNNTSQEQEQFRSIPVVCAVFGQARHGPRGANDHLFALDVRTQRLRQCAVSVCVCVGVKFLWSELW